MWKDKTFIALGATAGLAIDTLRWLAKEGASLVIHGRNEEKRSALAQELRELGAKVGEVGGSVESATLGKELWDAQSALGSTPYGFLCFVGIPGRLKPEEWTPEAFAQIFAVNCSGPLLACRYWANQMKEQGHAGNAVLLSTMQANYPFEGSLPYSLGKVALQQGIQILAKEFAPSLRINGIAPGVNEAGMALASIQRGKYQPYVDDQRIPRYGNPADLQHAMAFLLKPDLYMTGQTMLLDGGFTLRRDMKS